MLMSHDVFVEALGKVEVKWFKDRFVTSQDFRHVFVWKNILRERSFENRKRRKNRRG